MRSYWSESSFPNAARLSLHITCVALEGVGGNTVRISEDIGTQPGRASREYRDDTPINFDIGSNKLYL